MRKPHAAWWEAFWSQSSVTLPAAELAISRQYHLVQYFHGAASRRGAPPMPLQGVWTADNGGLPPWKGDYHNDLNTQMTYIAYQSAGHFDEGLSYLDYLWDRREVFAEFARDFYGTPGAGLSRRHVARRSAAGRLGPIQPVADDECLERPSLLLALALHGG